MEVTTKHIVPMNLESSVRPVFYEDDQGKEEDPILIMKLSKN